MAVALIELRVSRAGSIYVVFLDEQNRALTAIAYRDWGRLLSEQGRTLGAAPRLVVRSDALDELRARASHADNREFIARGGY